MFKYLFFAVISFPLMAQYQFTNFDLNPAGDSYPTDFAEINGKMIFSASDAVHGMELWVSDGLSSGGTYLLKDVYGGVSGSSPRRFNKLDNRLLFFANDADHGSELWSTDGTEVGTYLVKDIVSGTAGSIFLSGFTAYNGKLYFVMEFPGFGSELWVTDGTSTGTQMVKDIYLGNQGSNINEITVFNNQLFFSADNGVDGFELWTSNGTTTGTVLFKQIGAGAADSYPHSFQIMGDNMYFIASPTAWDQNEIWVSDGTSSGTQQLIPASLSEIYNLQTTENTIYFDYNTSTFGKELWMSDGTLTGTHLLVDFNPGVNSGNPGIIGYFEGKLYFQVDNGNGNSLWVTDGTEVGTNQLIDIAPVGESGQFNFLKGFNHKVFTIGSYSMPNPDLPWETIWNHQLYVSDGTAAGTSLIEPTIAPVFNPLYVSNQIFEFEDALFFNAHFTSEGAELWKLEDLTLNTNTKLQNDFVQLYPNPSVGNWMIYFNVETEILSSHLIDLSGKEFLHTLTKLNNTSNLLESSELGVGIYILTLDTPNGTMRLRLVRK